MSKDPRKSLALSRKIPEAMKKRIMPYVNTGSRYDNGRMFGLRKPPELSRTSPKASGVSFGADSKGFFVYTHRCRSKSKHNWRLISKREIDFVESTG